MEDLFASLIDDFVAETEPLAQQVASLALQLEVVLAKGEDPEESFRAIKSTLHTIKGNAAMMGLAAIESTAHALEEVCGLAVAHPEVQDTSQSQILIEGSDLLVRFIREALSKPPEKEEAAAFLQRVGRVVAAGGMNAAPSERCPTAREPSGAPSPSTESSQPGTVTITDQTVDGLLDLTADALVTHAELMRVRARLARGQATRADLAALDELLATVGRVTSQLRHDLLRVRLAPIGGMFRRFIRYVRDLSRERAQPIQLVIEGGDTAVDRAIIRRLFEPLVHMVRNSVAHGIERPDEREASGKPARAQVLLSARLVEGRVRVVVADDGRGLDLEAISHRASQMGLHPELMDERELAGLIFRSGFSTASEVSTLAGRGVGLDVVASVVQGLSGTIDVRSVRGQGTVFMIDLPVSVSLCRALVFGVDSESFALPATFVAGSVRTRDARGGETDDAGTISWRDESLAALDGGRLLGCSGLAQAWMRPYAIIIQASNQRCALTVDWLTGVQEIVIKPVDESLAGSRLLSGVTILGQGRVVPVLDGMEVARRSENVACTGRSRPQASAGALGSASHVF